MSVVPLYDDLSEDYDHFVNWPARLAFELPFFRRLFEQHHIHSVLDVACGTGQHAIALAREGYEVAAADLSQAMVERAQANAAQAGVNIHVYALGFGALAGSLPGRYDALLCLGNSLPHVTTEEALSQALGDLARVLKPGGLLVIQNRNLDRVLARQERFMSPEVHRAGEDEWVFYRFYDFLGDLLRFNMVRLHRRGEGEWIARTGYTQLRAWRYELLQREITTAGMEAIHAYGSYRGEPFDLAESGDLVLTAKRSTI